MAGPRPAGIRPPGTGPTPDYGRGADGGRGGDDGGPAPAATASTALAPGAARAGLRRPRPGLPPGVSRAARTSPLPGRTPASRVRPAGPAGLTRRTPNSPPGWTRRCRTSSPRPGRTPAMSAGRPEPGRPGARAAQAPARPARPGCPDPLALAAASSARSAPDAATDPRRRKRGGRGPRAPPARSGPVGRSDRLPVAGRRGGGKDRPGPRGGRRTATSRAGQQAQVLITVGAVVVLVVAGVRYLPCRGRGSTAKRGRKQHADRHDPAQTTQPATAKPKATSTAKNPTWPATRRRPAPTCCPLRPPPAATRSGRTRIPRAPPPRPRRRSAAAVSERRRGTAKGSPVSAAYTLPTDAR